MAGKGTTHLKAHSLTGWGFIIGLPFALWSVIVAVSHIADKGRGGFTDWLSTPHGAVGFLAFFTAAIWYCKLEFDEVIMDYFDGGLRSFGLLANRIVPCLVWLLAAYAVLKLAFLG